MNRFRWWLIRLLIGKAVVVKDAHIKGELIVQSAWGGMVCNNLIEAARCPVCDKRANRLIARLLRELRRTGVA